MRRTEAQAALEYVGLLALVGVLALAVAPSRPPQLAASVTRALKHGMCLATGAVCSARAARDARLAPCPVHVRASAEDASAKVAVVRVGRGDALVVTRRSDGTAAVSFVDGWRAGAEAGVGVSLGGFGGRAHGGAGVAFNAGRTWEFEDWRAAERFLARHARHETLTGELRARLPFTGEPKLPPAHTTFREGGGYAEGNVGGRVPKVIEMAGEASARGLLGHSRAGSRRTLYYRIATHGRAQLGTVLAALGTGQESEGVLAYTEEGGRPVELRISGSAILHGEVSVLGSTADIGRLADRLRRARAGARAGEGAAAEVSVALDLTDPANLAAVKAGPLALATRLDAAGTIDARLFSAGRTHTETGADAGLAAAGYERTERTRRLIGAWSRRPQGSLQEREDCVTAASNQRN